MLHVVRVIGVSLLGALLGAGLGRILFRTEEVFAAFIIGCVGALVGAVAGAAHEISAAVRSSSALPPDSP